MMHLCITQWYVLDAPGHRKGYNETNQHTNADQNDTVIWPAFHQQSQFHCSTSVSSRKFNPLSKPNETANG